MEQPGEAGGGAQRHRIRHRAYPCREAGGVIFTYMGPGEPPLFPGYEPFLAPPGHVLVTRLELLRIRADVLEHVVGNQ